MISIHLCVEEPLPTELLGPFQKGAVVQVEVGNDLLTLLTKDLCLTEEGLTKIQTIFWQSKPVDDLAACVVHDGGVLALSAALPGLVGACLRRGGAWSALRDTISHHGEGNEDDRKPGTITVKLFNFMLAEVGPLLLKRGILVQPSEVRELLTPPPVKKRLLRLKAHGQEIPLSDLERLLTGNSALLLSVETDIL